MLVSWNPAYDDTGVSQYIVYRNGSALATVSGSTLQYVDINAALNTTYEYTVEAVDPSGHHSLSRRPCQ